MVVIQRKLDLGQCTVRVYLSIVVGGEEKEKIFHLHNFTVRLGILKLKTLKKVLFVVAPCNNFFHLWVFNSMLREYKTPIRLCVICVTANIREDVNEHFTQDLCVHAGRL